METKELEATVPPPLRKKPEDNDVEQVTSTNKKTKPQKDPGRVAAVRDSLNAVKKEPGQLDAPKINEKRQASKIEPRASKMKAMD